MVKEVTSDSEFSSEISKPGLTLVDFYADWCGPCRKIAPHLDSLEQQFPTVSFIKVNGDNLQGVLQQCGVRAFPTFHMYKAGKKVDEMKGANPSGLTALVEKCMTQHGTVLSMGAGGGGNTLGGSASTWNGVGQPPSAKEQRAAFLAALDASTSTAPAAPIASTSGAASSSAPAPPTAGVEGSMEIDVDEDEEMAKAIALSMQAEPTSASDPATETKAAAAATQDSKDEAEARAEVEKSLEIWDGEEMVPLPVDEDLLKQLMSMGFSDCRARKGIHHGTTLEGAVSWIENNESDPNIDQPYMVRKKDTLPKVELSPEEFAARVEETKNKIAQRRAERQEHEKKKAREDEKMRRERGKQMAQTQVERDALQRKRDMETLKRQKREEKEHKERILAQIKADKAIRKANNGKLHSALGVDGYNPSITHSAPAGASADASSSSSAAPAPVAAPVDLGPPGPRIDSALEKVMRHRAAGVGGAALKLLVTFVKNIVEKPDEVKYRSINAAGNAFKSKLAPVTGSTIILKALGFVKNDENKYVLGTDADTKLLSETLDKLVNAEAEFRRLNPC